MPLDDGKEAHVLIVEDDLDLRDGLALLLEDEGFRVTLAENGREALQRLEALEDGERPDVILLDLMMPVMDGREFRHRQRADDRFRTIPVVLLSAVPNVEQLKGELGAAAALRKPVTVEELLLVLHKVERG